MWLVDKNRCREMDVEIVRHSEVNEDILCKIISIKTISWPHSFDSQLKWIEENLDGGDLHVLLYINSELVCYLNLVNVEVEINNCKYSVLGIGNVCSKYRGKGFGNNLMEYVNDYLLQNSKIGLLFCKEALVPFYKKNNWSHISNEITNLSNSIETFIYNYNNKVESLSYTGRNF